MRLAIDAMGGDFAPEPIVKGALEALVADPELHVVLVGNRELIQPFLEVTDHIAQRIEIEHATEVVEMHESPARAMRAKPKSSINVCWGLAATGKVDGLISAGNTGAVVAGGLGTRRFLANIQRPGIAVTVPSPNGWSVMLDVGANIAPKPEHLFQYGLMGRIFAKQLLGRAEPTIGLLNVGTEDSKGNALAKTTAELFQNSLLAPYFRGNIEGRDVCRGIVDVIVCEGFVGNIVLKCCEGLVEFLMREVGQELATHLNVERDLAGRLIGGLGAKYHYSSFGGAPLLGIDGVCLICHGASDATAIRNAAKTAKRYGLINKLITKEMEDALASSK